MRSILASRGVGLFAAVALVLLPVLVFAQHWREIAPVDGPAPSPRSNATAIYDPVDHRVIVFGGRGSGGALNDVWSFDLETSQWTDLTPLEGLAPAPRLTPAGVYDHDGRQMVMWSGQGNAFFNDIWTFDLAENVWTELTPPAPVPNIRYGVASVFDPLARNLVTFAGFTDQGRFDDTWAFDVEQNAWSDVTPDMGPMQRCLHTASYDAGTHRMLIYGGQRSGPLGDLWSFDLSSGEWTELLSSTTPPEGRYFAASVYDETNDRLLVFGGNRGSAGLSNEVWSFAASTAGWMLESPSGTSPEARQGAVAVYVESEDRVIFFGGQGSTHLNDVWSLDLESATTSFEPDETPRQTTLRLYPNYPNPVASSTTIEYELERAMPAAITVYDLQGRAVNHLAEGMHAAGRHAVTWDGRDAAGHRLAPGVYICRLRGGGAVSHLSLVVGR
ncbi:MAG TPA: kelch repeat-containing protein [Rhodothermales bacterium]|nr:kelch repeat-containing protein [Rhodothermales bacterium]